MYLFCSKSKIKCILKCLNSKLNYSCGNDFAWRLFLLQTNSSQVGPAVQRINVHLVFKLESNVFGGYMKAYADRLSVSCIRNASNNFCSIQQLVSIFPHVSRSKIMDDLATRLVHVQFRYQLRMCCLLGEIRHVVGANFLSNFGHHFFTPCPRFSFVYKAMQRFGRIIITNFGESQAIMNRTLLLALAVVLMMALVATTVSAQWGGGYGRRWGGGYGGRRGWGGGWGRRGGWGGRGGWGRGGWGR